jgi:hypothetical protein
MLPEQKRAWFVVVIIVIALAGVAAVVPFAGVRAWPAVGLFSLVGLAPFLFRPKLKPGEVASDERDQKILLGATLGGFAASHTWFVLACMAPWFFCVFRGEKAISIQVLPVIVISDIVVWLLTRAVSTLVLYRREGANGAH